jgi:16S rRNA (adenine1518-N6/adenine1519-N6)-dimethyltransferase
MGQISHYSQRSRMKRSNSGSLRRRVGPRRPAAKKSLGQNFLVDSRIVSRILAVAEVGPEDTVLEIGPGRGALTAKLAGVARRLVAVELDDVLAANLRDRFASAANVEIVHGDARELDLEPLFDAGERYKLIANLPYYAASRIVRQFLTAHIRPTSLVVMLQREVARTMAAAPGRMGLLSVMVQLYGAPRIAFSVPPRAFRPVPKVTSSVIRIDVLDTPALALDSEEQFFRLVTAGFSAPRKQVHNSLGNGLDISGESARTMLESAGIEAVRRPGTLSVQEWGQLYQVWRTREPEVLSSGAADAND